MTVKFDVDDLGSFVRESKIAASGCSEWVIVHSFLIDEDKGRASVSPPMLALKWEMAQVIFNSLLEEGMRNVAVHFSDAYLAVMDNHDDMFRLGIFPEMSTEVYPLEVLMLLDRRSLSDEMYYDLYLKEGPGETKVYEVPIDPNTAPKPTTLH
ncbi:TPA: hypothetical protein ACODIZ_003623 [Salmonella enterica subsp. enterica serovar Newport]|nr:hypothetical protein [Salmonella enterica subsp. enterica serovar Typhimurium]